MKNKSLAVTPRSLEIPDKSTDIVLSAPNALTGLRKAAPSPFVQLTRRILFRKNGPQVIAVLPCGAHPGSMQVCSSFWAYLNSDLGANVTLLSATECLERWSGDPNQRENMMAGLVPSEKFLSVKSSGRLLLIDCPSLDSSPVALVLAGQVDGIVLVAEEGKTSKAQVRAILSEIKAAGGSVFGVILNETSHSSILQKLESLFSRRSS